jgi:hypothetical protein
MLSLCSLKINSPTINANPQALETNPRNALSKTIAPQKTTGKKHCPIIRRVFSPCANLRMARKPSETVRITPIVLMICISFLAGVEEDLSSFYTLQFAIRACSDSSKDFIGLAKHKSKNKFWTRPYKKFGIRLKEGNSFCLGNSKNIWPLRISAPSLGVI